MPDMNMMLWILIIIVMGVFLYMQFGTVKGLSEYDAGQFADAMKNTPDVLVIDVREAGEFKSGHIEGAKNMPLSSLSERMGELPKDKKLLLYCQSGMRSKRAGKMLIKHGYDDVVNLKGGIIAWANRR